MSFWSFLGKSIVLLIICIIASGGILAYRGEAHSQIAVGAGLAISFGNALIGFAFLSWGYKRSYKAFLASIYGGIIFRFLLIFSVLFVLIGALNLNRVALLLSLVSTYFLFMGLEIFQIHKYSDRERK